jgi:hypothetical protein
MNLVKNTIPKISFRNLDLPKIQILCFHLQIPIFFANYKTSGSISLLQNAQFILQILKL